MDDEIYELARQRVNKRNRQMMFFGMNILAMFLYLGAFAALGDVIPKGIGVFIAIAWVGVVAFHAMMIGVLQNRRGEIDQEVEKLREAIYNEKPKRKNQLELTDDGELVGDAPLDYDELPYSDEAYKDSV